MKDLALMGKCAIINEEGKYFDGYDMHMGEGPKLVGVPRFVDVCDPDFHDMCYLEAMIESEKLENKYGIKTRIRTSIK